MESYICAIANSGLKPILLITGEIHRPRAFSLSVREDDLMSIRIFGLDSEQENNRSTDYPRLFLYEPLLISMKLGIKHLEFGVSALYAKMLRGVNAVPLYSLVKLPNNLKVKHIKGGDKMRISNLSKANPKLSRKLVADWEVENV